MTRNFYAGIDIGGTNTAIGIIDETGSILAQSSFSTHCADNIEDYVEEMYYQIKMISDTIGGIDQITTIGIGAPNVNRNDEIGLCENLPWEMPAPLAATVRKRFGLPVAIANDANAAAIGEMTYGVAKGMENFIVITLGTGVGSGIVADGRLICGHRGFGGELGHIVIRRDGRQCTCGKKGCLEAYCSATGVARSAREMLEADTSRETTLRNIDLAKITSKIVYEAAMQGDQLALEVFQTTGNMLGEALADFMTYSDPEAIILFGGLTKSGDLLMKPVKESFRKNLLQIWKHDEVKILISGLKGSEAALLGAAAMAQQLHLNGANSEL